MSRRNALNASPTINPFTVQRAGPRCEQPAALNPETDFRDPGFHGSYGQGGKGDLSTSSHSAFRRSTTRISAELSGPRLVQGADKEINKIRRKSCLVSKKRTTQLNFSSQFLNPSCERNARGYIFHN